MKTLRQELVPIIVLLGVGLLCYANSFHNEFVWDDHPQVVNNRLLRSWTFAPLFFTTDSAEAYGVPSNTVVRFYRPLWLMLELAEYQAWGPSAFGFHLLNFLLHLGNTLLFFFVMRTLSVRRPFAVLAAALFLCHPAHLETTTFVAGSVALLSVFFMLVALLAFLKFLRADNQRGSRWPMLGLSVLAYGLALLSKEIAVTLPAVLLAAALLLPERRKRSRKEWLIVMAGYGLATVAYLIVRDHVLAHSMYSSAFPWPQRCVLALRALAGYVGLTVAPVNLYPEKTVALTGLKWTLLTLAGGVVAAGLMTAAIWFWKRDRRVTFGLAWFVASFSLISNVVTVNPTFAERWLYWPLLGLLLAAATAVEFILHRRRSAGTGLLVAGWCIVAVFSVLTILQNRVWHDDVTLFETTIRRGGDTPLMRTALALTYMDENKFDQAETELQSALLKNPGDDTALAAMGDCVAARGDVAEATNWFVRALQANPREMRTVASLAWAQEKLGDLEGASQTLQTWLTHTRDSFIATKLGNFYYRHDRLAEAEQVLRKALARNPDYAPAHNSLGTVLFREDRLDESEAEFQQALRLDPWLAFAHANLAAKASKRGDVDAALEHYKKALSLEPQNAGFYRALATVLEQHGRTNEATQVLQRARDLEAKQPAQDLLP